MVHRARPWPRYGTSSNVHWVNMTCLFDNAVLQGQFIRGSPSAESSKPAQLTVQNKFVTATLENPILRADLPAV